jgi:hypothetical protein
MGIANEGSLRTTKIIIGLQTSCLQSSKSKWLIKIVEEVLEAAGF